MKKCDCQSLCHCGRCCAELRCVCDFTCERHDWSAADCGFWAVYEYLVKAGYQARMKWREWRFPNG